MKGLILEMAAVIHNCLRRTVSIDLRHCLCRHGKSSSWSNTKLCKQSFVWWASLGNQGQNTLLSLRHRQAPLTQRKTLYRVNHYHSSCVHCSETGDIQELDDIVYHKLADETLEELAEFFDELGDSGLCPEDYDSTLASGVLNVRLGGDLGSYVINKQLPNKQIWLSSPVSGPKRYDLIDGRWRYSHNCDALHDLLTREFSETLDTQLDFGRLKHSYLVSDEGNWS